MFLSADLVQKMPNDPTVHFEYNEDGAARSRVVYENGDSEQLKLTAVAPELYRLEESSFAGEAVYGDTIRAHRILFREIAGRSTLTTQSWILSESVLGTERIRRVLARVINAGGMWEQAFGGMLIVHTPPDIAETVFREITETSSNAIRSSAASTPLSRPASSRSTAALIKALGFENPPCLVATSIRLSSSGSSRAARIRTFRLAILGLLNGKPGHIQHVTGAV